MDAVRAALGYYKVDYYGGSYGGADVTAYATRFGDHLRSIVLDAPVGTPGLGKAFALDQYRTHAEPGMVSRDCERSPTCSRDHPFPQLELDGLIWTVRVSPVVGDAYDANGNLMHVRIDENALLNYLIDNPTGNFASTGELVSAARSLWQGDSRPLLRLGAEGYFPLVGDSGDPTVFSIGAYLGSLCADQTQAFDWTTPLPARADQFADAVSALPFWYFAPFSKKVGAGLLFSIGNRSCLYWEIPTPSSPVALPHPAYSRAPTMVLTGDLDNRVPTPEVSKVAALFPNSTLVPVVEAGHETVFWTTCAANLASGFVETLQVGDISCTETPETVWPAVGRFPLLAKDARPAAIDPNGHNQIGLAERKVVTVAVATATDALQRSIIGSGTGVGLRAGTFQTNYGATAWTTTLTNCAFSKDVTVNGTVTWDIFGALTATLTVSGPGTAGGTLYVQGTWQAPEPVGNFSVSGTLGTKQVAVLVPEA
jgi:pimeloyl-ACP methyl ester carboxylesterase